MVPLLLAVPTTDFTITAADLTAFGSARLAYYGLFGGFLILPWILCEVAASFLEKSTMFVSIFSKPIFHFNMYKC